jgi:hypothetical protein
LFFPLLLGARSGLQPSITLVRFVDSITWRQIISDARPPIRAAQRARRGRGPGGDCSSSYADDRAHIWSARQTPAASGRGAPAPDGPGLGPGDGSPGGAPPLRAPPFPSYGQEGTYNFREYDGRTNGSAHSLSVSYSDSWAAETSTHDFAGSLVTPHQATINDIRLRYTSCACRCSCQNRRPQPNGFVCRVITHPLAPADATASALGMAAL